MSRELTKNQPQQIEGVTREVSLGYIFSVEDSLLDLAVYSIIGLVLYRENNP